MSQTFTSDNDQPAVQATNSSTGLAVRGDSTSGAGVFGRSLHSDGIHGRSASPQNPGVSANNESTGPGLFAESRGGEAIQAQNHSDNASTITASNSGSGAGVFGHSSSGPGVQGRTANLNAAVAGINESVGIGVLGESFGDGVQGRSKANANSGVAGFNDFGGNGVLGQSARGVGVFGRGSPAGHFEGNVEVTGNINCHQNSTITCFDVSLTGGDCAEDFDVVDDDNGVEPGTVMVIDNEGALQPSAKAYDRRVAGVISGAGECKPGIVLNKRPTSGNRKPVALVGRVYCKVDADYSPVDVGDLLTTSSTPGHAMKAVDSLKAFGAVIGKALAPLREGLGLIPILVALQ
jgi:hypothetical protein